MPTVMIDVSETLAVKLMKRGGWSGTLAGQIQALLKEVLDGSGATASTPAREPSTETNGAPA